MAVISLNRVTTLFKTCSLEHDKITSFCTVFLFTKYPRHETKHHNALRVVNEMKKKGQVFARFAF